ncbi:patatin-like phospholipase family protein [Paenisporosarcina macmurdoensis]|uniref:Patatin-like phospholipase family protein n=1 Tax=Paenisporosarcina macmurdoensis TaxID=212659 RepID=A0ABW1L417_9BACL
MLIDGVFSGGGLKDFALVGAYQELEEKGFRFHRVAGTSAGAILACFIAAGYTGKEIEEMLNDQDFQTLLDPRKTILPLPVLKWFLLYWRMGLYQGNALEKWFMEKLTSKGVYTFGDLPDGKLKLIASDLTNGKMLVLPDDLAQFGISANTFPLARALRMSCGIPFFFEPVKLKVGYGETIVVDGGVLSNFPMWLFDEPNGKRQRPVLGMKISRGHKDSPAHLINNGLNLFEALFSTMQNAHDEKYISRKHEKDIIFIPVDDTSTTQFDLSQETKAALMESGRKSTIQFLKTWSPPIDRKSYQTVHR